ncbi:hypothetical protein FRUB_02973 [Fimbriiglobus ruber]|uniref:Uncharacterized protein n=1 Tax=Fimbriiglobus ruber TaxID=1908690 RepID=A0A225DUP6_9BACT|nr:hypothetical protein FRUB_02973 [Fimbriiglobus ruber]
MATKRHENAQKVKKRMPCGFVIFCAFSCLFVTILHFVLLS